jgi:SAF domain
MPLPIRAVLIHATDDVASVLGDAREGDTLVIECYGGTPPRASITAAEAIPFGHKVAIRDMPSGTVVRKYSHPIGQLIVDTRLGQHVHTQNLQGMVAGK